jgi:small-conductance mechanosensitive channel
MGAHWHEDHPSDEETAKQRLDRNFSELLQELRVTQTGVQILLGFLLTMVFSSGFEKVDGWKLTLYAVAVSTAVALALVVALGNVVGVIIGGCTLVAIAALWYLLPLWALIAHRDDNVDEPNFSRRET